MPSPVKRFDIQVSAALLVWPLLLWILTNNRPPWGDEVRYLETIRLFGRGLSWDLLKTYPDLTTPLTFLVYSAWGHLVGFSTPHLRLLAPLLAWATATLWWLTLRREVHSLGLSLIALAAVVLNPYFVGLSIFVFTDTLALLGLMTVLWGIETRRPWLSALGLGLATGTRQYLVFAAPALVFAEWMVRPQPAQGRWSFSTAALLGLLPLAGLVALWGGHLAPDGGFRETYLSDGVRFDPHALSLYLAVPGAYIAMLVMPAAHRAGRDVWSIAACTGLFALLFRVQPSIVQTRAGHATVGFLHRAASFVLPPELVTVFFALLAAVATAALLYCGRQALREWQAGRRTMADLFAWGAIVSFLVIMPFSYMPWERYALPLTIPVTLVLAKELQTARRRDEPVVDYAGAASARL